MPRVPHLIGGISSPPFVTFTVIQVCDGLCERRHRHGAVRSHTRVKRLDHALGSGGKRAWAILLLGHTSVHQRYAALTSKYQQPQDVARVTSSLSVICLGLLRESDFNAELGDVGFVHKPAAASSGQMCHWPGTIRAVELGSHRSRGGKNGRNLGNPSIEQHGEGAITMARSSQSPLNASSSY